MSLLCPPGNLTTLTAQRNRLWWRAADLAVGLPHCEQAGATTLQNVGVGASVVTDWAGYSFSGAVTGTLYDSTGDDEHPCVNFMNGAAAGDGYATLWNPTEADLHFKVYTLALQFKSLETATVTYHLFDSGTVAAYRMRIFRVANSNTLRIALVNAANVATNVDFTIADWTTWHTVVVACDPATGKTRVYLDTPYATAATAYQEAATADGFKVIANASAKLGAVYNAANPGAYNFAGVSFWPVALTTVEVAALLTDARGPFRPYPDVDTQWGMCVPYTGRPTATGISAFIKTGHGTLAFTDSLQWRLLYWVRADGPATAVASDPATISSTAAHDTRAIVAIAGLTADTRYDAIGEYSVDDGDNWVRLPVAPCTWKTAAATTARLGVVGDTHGSSDEIDARGVGFAADEIAAAALGTPSSVKNRAHATRLSNHFLARDIALVTQPDLTLFLGDVLQIDRTPPPATGNELGDYDAGKNLRAARLKESLWPIACAGPVADVPGNHEGMLGENVRGDSGAAGAYQKMNSAAWHAHVLNPTNGPDTGPVTASSTQGWVPPLNMDAGDATLDADFRAAYMIDAAGRNTDAECSWQLTVGPVDVFGIDVTRGSNVGDPQSTRQTAGKIGDRDRNTPVGRQLQPEIWTWLEAALAASTATFKVLAMHNPPCGEDTGYPGTPAFYGKGTGARLSTVDELRLEQLAAQHGCIIVWAHNHCASVVFTERYAVPIVTVPQTGFWALDQNDHVFGTAASGPLGAPHIVDEAGNPMPAALRWAADVCGYAYIDFDATLRRARLVIRQTDYRRDANVASAPNLLTYDIPLLHWVPRFTADAAGNVSLPEAYREIVAVFDADDLTGEWWLADPAITNHKPTDPGYLSTPYDQPGTVTLALGIGFADKEVGILAAPMNLAIGIGVNAGDAYWDLAIPTLGRSVSREFDEGNMGFGNLQILDAVAGDGKDHAVEVPAGKSLLVGAVDGEVQVRDTADSVGYFPIADGDRCDMGGGDGQTIFVRGEAGTTIMLALR